MVKRCGIILVLLGVLFIGFILGQVFADAQKKGVSIRELKERPEVYLEKTIVIKGKLRNIGSGYFENFEFILEDEEGNRIHVKPWLPFEVIIPPPWKKHKMPRVMGSYLERWLLVTGKVKINPGNIRWIKGSHYIEVQTAEEVGNN